MRAPAARSIAHSVGVAPLALVVCGCAMMFQGAQTGEQIKPPEAHVSPKMDFTRISKLGVFPLFPSGGIEEQTFAEGLIAALTSALEARQAQWQVQGYREVVSAINERALGTGYKNLQADFNTFAGPGGQFVLSPATRKFLGDLQRTTGVDAFLIGTYSLTQEPRLVRGPLGPVQRVVDVSTVRVTLYYAKDAENWWTASTGRYGARAGVIDEIAKSLGAYLGKGTLRQL